MVCEVFPTWEAPISVLGPMNQQLGLDKQVNLGRFLMGWIVKIGPTREDLS